MTDIDNYFMGQAPDWKKIKKYLKENKMYNKLLIIGLVLLLFSFCIGCGSDTAEPEQEIKLVSYEVESIENISFGNVDRFTWHVIINEPATTEELKEVAKEVLEEAKAKEKFNALSIMFYDYPEYMGHGYTLGDAIFAPEGDWSKADSVRSGEYDKMSFSWKLRNKDWSQQLSPDEVKVWASWNDAYSKVFEDMEDEMDEDPFALPDEDEITAQVAEEHGISAEEVSNILSKQSLWMFMDE
ncbi:DUF4875 domain-containing protein [Candidatus Contubernalis alkaliaceticus]|uniref:DUF4875 domain-containing protein n=1 Tax=Candidatus Contubernalis alkaliaceticus TaxID=338645 RepID=UPI001F4C5039|nr:hypothetical protein [Candidatus Contubernalis alkalaceticus]UNC91636.1 hypothetical protein HUE98_05745 [Candidatus Contubernalis alkalaceticus]